MPDVKQIVRDPNFLGLPTAERQKVLQAVDPNFAGLSNDDQLNVVNSLGSVTTTQTTTPAAAPPASTTDTEVSQTASERMQDYLLRRGKQYTDALGRLTGFDESMGVQGPGRAGTPIPGPSSVGQLASDVALVGGVAAQPELTLLGLGLGTAARGAGASQDAADAVELATQVVGGGTQAVLGGRAAVRAPGIARRAQAVENVAGNIGEAGEAAQLTRGGAAATGAAGISDAARTGQAVTGNLGAGISEAGEAAQTVRGTAAAAGAEGISDAALTSRATDKISALRGETPAARELATPGAGGTRLRETFPKVEAGQRSAFQEATYDKIGKFADDKGLGATLENPVGQKLGTSLLDANESWGPLAGSAEHKQVQGLIDRLTKGEKVPWTDLDKAEKALIKVRGPSSVRRAISDAKYELLEGTPAAAALKSANATWKETIVPAKRLAEKIVKAESPTQAFYRVMGTGKDPQRMEIVRNLLQDHHPEAWEQLVGGYFTDLVQKAGGDPIKAARMWQTVRPSIKAQLDPSGVADAAFNDLLTAGSRTTAAAKPLSEIPARGLPAASEAPRPVTLPEPVSRSLPPERMPSQFMQGAAIAGGGLTAIERFYHGDWKGGLAALGVGTILRDPALAVTFGRGAAPALGRTAVGVAATPYLHDETPVE